MRILPINMNYAAQMMYGAFMETVMPNPVNYDMQDVLNNMVSSRVFTQNAGAGGVQTLTPMSYPSYQTSPAPAWTTVQGFRGKRVLPKVKLPYSDQYADINWALPAMQGQLDVIMSTILNHRVASTASATTLAANPSASSGMVLPAKNSDGTWTVAEYDFGAEVSINAAASVSLTTTYNILATNATINLWLQVQSGNVWTDVTNVTTNISSNSANVEKYFQFPTNVVGRKFRLVSKATTFPLSAIGSFYIHFYGDYTSGTSPRTLTKVQHVVMMPLTNATTYTGSPVMSTSYTIYSYGRLFAHYALSVSDDIKLAASTDVIVSDASPYPGQDQTVGIITINNKIINTEAY